MTTLVRVIKLGLKNFWRNGWLTLGATLLMTLTLSMISVSLIMSITTNSAAEQIKSKIDLTIYFREDSVPDEQLLALGEALKKVEGVKEVKFVSKQQALQIFTTLPVNKDILEPLSSDNNPLPRSLQISTNSPEQIESVVSKLYSLDTQKVICSDCVSYSKNKDTIERLISVTRAIQQIGLLLSIFFGVIAVFNVYNIIKLTIISRRDEIEIMRFVGASNIFVRGPFIIEGVLYGLIATIFTTVFLWLTALILSSLVKDNTASSALSLLGIDLINQINNNLPLLVSVQLLIGIVLGSVVSSISIRKYLKL